MVLGWVIARLYRTLPAYERIERARYSPSPADARMNSQVRPARDARTFADVRLHAVREAVSLEHDRRRPGVAFEDHQPAVRPLQGDDLRHLLVRVAQSRRQREHDHVGRVARVDVADVGRPFGDLARHRREQLPGALVAGVQHLRDLGGRELEAPPVDVVAQALEAPLPLAEAVQRLDDLAPQVVLRLVAQVRRPGRLQDRRQVGGVGRVADDVGLEVGGFYLRLQPGEDDLVLGRGAQIIHTDRQL